jgi:hypothetical protein
MEGATESEKILFIMLVLTMILNALLISKKRTPHEHSVRNVLVCFPFFVENFLQRTILLSDIDDQS